jgi:hypothetical protein
MKPTKNKEETGFLNVDLDVYSQSNLEALAAALAHKTFVLHVGREGNRYGAHFELTTLPKNADAIIRGFAALIRALPRPARRLWDSAKTREFNIGLQAASAGKPIELHISPETIHEVASLGGQLAITVYPARFPIIPLAKLNRRALAVKKKGHATC